MRRRTLVIAAAIVVTVLAGAIAFGSWFAKEERRVVGRATMRSVLIDLARAQSRYFNGTGTFARDLAQLNDEGISFSPVDVVTITIERADSMGWHARATTPLATATCTISGRAPPGAVEPATADVAAVPQCQ